MIFSGVAGRPRRPRPVVLVAAAVCALAVPDGLPARVVLREGASLRAAVAVSAASALAEALFAGERRSLNRPLLWEEDLEFFSVFLLAVSGIENFTSMDGKRKTYPQRSGNGRPFHAHFQRSRQTALCHSG